MMTILMFFGMVVGLLYGTLLLFAGVTQIKKSEFEKWSVGLMAILGGLLDLGLFLWWLEISWSIIPLVISLLGIQILGIHNGWYAYKKVHFSHQIPRLFLSLGILILLEI